MRDVVDPKLYDFLRENETGMFQKSENEVVAYVHIDFYDLGDFVEIVGGCFFDEGGMEIQLFRDTVCIELNDIIESDMHYLSSYKSCFDEFDWNRYGELIEEMEKD
jgi:hypothetical protein